MRINKYINCFCQSYFYKGLEFLTLHSKMIPFRKRVTMKDTIYFKKGHGLSTFVTLIFKAIYLETETFKEVTLKVIFSGKSQFPRI